MFRSYALATLVLALSSGSAQALDLNLRCPGVANVDTSSVDIDKHGTYWVPGSKTLPEVLRLKVTDGGVQAQLPKALVRGLGSGQEGWRALDDVEVSEDQISGRYRVNLIRRALVKLDRISGDLSVEGGSGYSFRGGCEVEDRSLENRKF